MDSRYEVARRYFQLSSARRACGEGTHWGRDKRAWRDWIKHFHDHRRAGRKNKTHDGVGHGAFG